MDCSDKMFVKDSEKIVVLYEEYRACMYKEAFRILKDAHLAEDAVQQAFIKILKTSLDKIDLRDVVKTKNFLIIICRNVSFDMYNKRMHLMASSDIIDFFVDNEECEIVGYDCPSKALISKETFNYVMEILDELPSIYKDVMILEHFHNYSKKEIAKLLNVNYDTIKKRSERARKILSERLDEKGVTLK